MESLFKKCWAVIIDTAVFGALSIVLSLSVIKASHAQSPIPVDTVACCWISCEVPGTTVLQAGVVGASLYANLAMAAVTLEIFIRFAVDNMVQAYHSRIDLMETHFQDWWSMFWEYDLRPSLQDMTAQLNTMGGEGVREYASFLDAFEQNMTVQDQSVVEFQRREELAPSENACTFGTQAGGFGRVTQIAKAMRVAEERQDYKRIINSTGTSSASGEAAVQKDRWNTYVAKFCDPADNNGAAGCAAAGPVPNADIKSGDTLFNQLTIDVTDTNKKVALEALVENLIGLDKSNPIPKSSMAGPVGREDFLNKRSYAARRSAAEAVPRLIAGWRMPGSRDNTFLKALRQDAGVSPTTISANPSYREVIHAIAVDRFLSGDYGSGMIETDSNVEHEKLMLSVFQLMMARDYYELLERQAVTLAVETGIVLDQKGQVATAGAGKVR